MHSSVDGHFGYFQVLAIVNSAAMDIGVHVFEILFKQLECLSLFCFDSLSWNQKVEHGSRVIRPTSFRCLSYL